MSGLRAIMDELADVLQDALGDATQVVGRLNLNPSGLSIDLYPGDPFRETTAAGFGDTSGELIFTVRARTDIADLDATQDVLLDLMDDENDLCVANILMDDQTLNGLATSVKVEGPSGFLPYGDNPGVQLGCQWRVTVLNLIT